MKSMTGFGRQECDIKGHRLQIELKTLNNRFLDLKYRSSSEYTLFESSFSKDLKKIFHRGFVELSIFRDKQSKQTATRIALDEDLLKAYLQSIQKAKKKFALEGKVQVSDLLGQPQFFKTTSEERAQALSYDVLWRAVGQCAQKVLKMRAKEGQALQKNLMSLLEGLQNEVQVLLKQSKALSEVYEKRLKTRIQEYLGDQKLDVARLHEEVAYLVSRSDISEELVRLSSHFDQFKHTLVTPGPIGKTLEFLTQELNREINTIGSKVQESNVTQCVVTCKSLLEKIREQIQNVE